MQVSVQRLLAKIGELTVALDVANERIAELEAAPAAKPEEGPA
jgi:hypothetical protein